MEIIEFSQRAELQKEIIQYFWECWGNDDNFKFYEDCILNSTNTNALPKFYIAIENNVFIGSVALLTNDIVSRQDLMPWLACLYVNEEKRGKQVGTILQNHATKEARSLGFDSIYLSTDLENYYEKNGWQYHTTAYNVFGEGFKVYQKPTDTK